ncbi:MAG: GNAT family N-acetyltransferase [Frankia sp.]
MTTDAQIIRIERVDVQRVLPLRQRVLRPHQKVTEVVNPGDYDPETAHLAALLSDPTGGTTVVGTASVHREQTPWDAGAGTVGWRLRGMASDPAHRGRGIGTSLLAATVDYVRTRSAVVAPGGNAVVLWCNARVSALGFYERSGLHTQGEQWDVPSIGPHLRMWRIL